jgi:hypothetical protein
MRQTLQFGRSILQFLPSLRPGQRQRSDTLHDHAESSTPYAALQGQVTRGAGWVPDLMRTRVERCLHARHPEHSVVTAW